MKHFRLLKFAASQPIDDTMSKSKAAKRKRAAEADATRKTYKTSTGIVTPPPDATLQSELSTLSTIVDDEELEITVDTLNLLAKHPKAIKSKACKDLRAAVYDFKQACTTGANTSADTSLTARTIAALADGKYTDALVLLAEMRIRGVDLKLGALCRIVRDLDVVSGLSMQKAGVSHTTIPRTPKENQCLAVLDAVLRVTGPVDTNLIPSTGGLDPISLQQVWDLRGTAPTTHLRASVLDGSLAASTPPSLPSLFRIVETTPGPLRKPPNHHAAILYTSIDNALPLSPDPAPTTYHAHPTVPALGLIKNVLSTAECSSIVAAAESLSFLPDAPVRDDVAEGAPASVLAHNFYWLVDRAFHDALWARVAPHVPARLAGRRVRGLNRRFRVYRYVPDAEYRCHIDGAWPPSGLARDAGGAETYVYDDSPAGAPQSSLATFLIYLNDEFEGGETTFFVPAAREGVLNAYPVRPVMGAVAVFPHGESRGALLHEGTGVRSGAKYVIRTDVLYDVKPDGGHAE